MLNGNGTKDDPGILRGMVEGWGRSVRDPLGGWYGLDRMRAL